MNASYPHMNHPAKIINVIHNGAQKSYRVRLESVGIFRYTDDPGQNVWAYHLSVNDSMRDYMLLFRGEVDKDEFPILSTGSEPIFGRVDSVCFPGQLYRVPTCDCGEQLYGETLALTKLSTGFIMHVPAQDGRGFGLDVNMAASYMREKHGYDMAQTDQVLGIISDKHDMRDLSGAVAGLKYLGLSTDQVINLATNNPIKIAALEENGFTVIRKKSDHMKTDRQSKHMRIKQEKLGHLK
jgi:GTP cyclohydrolase II